jgi:hypothetical protein
VGTVTTYSITSTDGGAGNVSDVAISATTPQTVSGLTPGKTYNILIQKEYTDPYTVPVSTATIPEGPQVTGYTVAELPDNPTIVDIFDVAEGKRARSV